MLLNKMKGGSEKYPRNDEAKGGRTTLDQAKNPAFSSEKKLWYFVNITRCVASPLLPSDRSRPAFGILGPRLANRIENQYN